MQAAIIVFPGSNCDRDIAVCLAAATGKQPHMVWHGDSELPQADILVLPGGFSYGDYLRGGAMAANSPIIRTIIARAEAGMPVLGICNGFQILTECGLLPGILMRNRGLHFICRNTRLIVRRSAPPFTSHYSEGEEIILPIAHNEGNYTADTQTLERLTGEGQIVFTYADGDNPNGAARDIAGIVNRQGNVLGMMPHPERHAEALLGGVDGKGIFDSLIESLS